MEYWETKINQLVVETENQPKTFVRSFTTKPTRNLAERSGRVFGLIEIESTDQKIPALIDLIIEGIKDHYYHQTNLKTEPKPAGINEKFEAALKKTNLTIASFLENQQISLELEKINLVIALVHNQELYFTVVGNASLILFYNIARNNYRIINVLETTHSPTATPDPLKLFSQIISGRMKPRDILFLSTANILDYFSLERIKNIVTDQLPAEGIAELKKLLANSKTKENFGALILELEKMSVPTQKTVNIQTFDYRRAASKDSIKELIRTEKETEKLLTPSILPEIKKYAGSFKAALQNYLSKVKSGGTTFYQKNKSRSFLRSVKSQRKDLSYVPESPRQVSEYSEKAQDKAVIRPNLNLQLGKKVYQTGKISAASLQKISFLIKSVIKKIIASIGRLGFWHRLLILLEKIFGQLAFRFKKMPRSSQVLLTITIILTVLFSASVIGLMIKNRREGKIEQLTQAIVEAENKKNEAAASLIYRDEGQARRQLIEAKNLLANLKPFSQSQADQILILTLAIEEELQKLRHFIEIAEPIQVVNFANLDSQATIANLLAISGKNIYTQNYNNQSLYKANLNTRVLAGIFSPDANTGNFTLTTALNDNELVFLNDSKSAFVLEPNTDTLKTVTINISDNANIVDITSYNNRLYLLDSANNQIYRYSKTAGGYGNVGNWITEEGLNLNNAKSLTVDGSIYILKTDGQIIKLQNGRQVDFQVTVIDPVLIMPTKIKTTDNSNFLYILDPANKRLVVLDKEGNLINQYISEKFDNLKDFIVLEAEKEIFLLNGSAIFGITAEHLK